MKRLIGKIYHWFWSDIMQRDEPYTKQIARIAQAHPILYRSGLGFIIGFLVVSFAFMVWFIMHIKDYIRRQPENKPK